MKAKLVKYPFNKKKYRWDTYKQGKKFLYTWKKSAIKDWDKILPYYTYDSFINNTTDTFGTVDMDNLGASYSDDISLQFKGIYTDNNDRTTCLYIKNIPDSVPRRVVTEYEDAGVWFSKPGTYNYNDETFEVVETPKIYYKVVKNNGKSYNHGVVLTKNGASFTKNQAMTLFTPRIGNSNSAAQNTMGY